MMAKDIVRMSIAGVALGAFLGLAAASGHAEDTAAGQRKQDTFRWLNSISGWNAVDEEHLVLYGPGQHHVALVTIVGPCVGLRQAENIAIKSTFSHIDAHGYGDIIYRSAGGIRSRCAIRTLENVKSLEDARRVVAQRKAAARTPSATP